MNNDIKEIQERLNYHKSIGIEPKYCEDLITTGELQRLLDYITNLQNELKYQKEMEDEYIEKHTKLLQDFTNLQEENEHLRTQLNTLENTVIEVNKECNRLFNHLTKKDLDYKTRNEKAIECIKHYAVENEDYSKIYNVEEKELLNILNGGDKE